ECPAPGCHCQRLVARPGKVVAPLTMLDARSVLGGDFEGTVGGTGVDDADFVDDSLYAPQAVLEKPLLVLHDHAQADALGQLLVIVRGRRQTEEERTRLLRVFGAKRM